VNLFFIHSLFFALLAPTIFDQGPIEAVVKIPTDKRTVKKAQAWASAPMNFKQFRGLVSYRFKVL
jgi:hypothetical protein